jgi:3-dehydrosphinganine reductase
MYTGNRSRYSIHCAFPSNFWTETFLEEQKRKPELTQLMESTAGPIDDLQGKLLTADVITDYIIGVVGKGEDFAICTDFIGTVLWSGMTGPSPKRGWGIVDGVLGVLSSFVVWPILRRHWDSLSRQAGRSGG